MSHDDLELERADCLAITFEMQKKEDKNDTVHHKATQDQTMCPIQAGAELMRRIRRSYPNTDGDTTISAMLIGSRITHVTMITTKLRR